MKYTKYISATIKANGTIHLSQDQLQRFMNIVYLESGIEVYETLSLNSPRIFSVISSKESKLNRLTKNLQPEELLQDLIRLSSVD